MKQDKFIPAPHIQALLHAEITTRGQYGGNIHFDRIGESSISVSCSGYCHQDLYDIEKTLLKLGCRYDLSKRVQQFDKQCGRTFTYFKEPTKGKGGSK